MAFRIDCKLHYSVAERSTYIMTIAAARTAAQQVIEDALSIAPECAADDNLAAETGTRTHRFVAPRGDLSVRYTARVAPRYEVLDPERLPVTPPDRLPLSHVPYIVPSRYCQSDQIMRFAFREFAGYRPGHAQVSAICDWIYKHVDYQAGSTGPMTTAVDTLVERAGVCRDFAHLGVAFCRALNIPARFVSGYAYDLSPPDFHAVFEAWLNGRWCLFDPTRRVSRTGFVRIGTGRDAADVPFALIIGRTSLQTMQVQCWHEPEPDGRDTPVVTELPVAVAA